MKKIILSAAIVLSVSAMTMAQSDKAASAPASTATAVKTDGPMMKFEKEEYNFGAIKQGD